jgi:hypothetical protein
MKVTKTLLFSVLHARHVGVPPMLGQTLPAEFDLDDYPTLLTDLGIEESDLVGKSAAEAVELTRIDADPHGQFEDSWRATARRKRRADLAADLDEPGRSDADDAPSGEADR